MKKITTIALLALLCLNLNAQEYVRGHLLVSFRNNVPHNEPSHDAIAFGHAVLDTMNKAKGCKNIRPLKRSTDGYGGVYLLTFPESADLNQLMADYEATGLFKSTSPNYIGGIAGVPNDTLFHKQWGLHNDGSFNNGISKAGADIDMLKAWDVEDGDTSIIVAVLDAGAKLDHTDFAGRLWTNTGEIPADSIDNDGNGYIDDTLGWNIVANTPAPVDDNGHGTHVMGILAANVNNTTGYAGVDQHCRLMVCKVANYQGLMQYAWLIEGIYYAVDAGADVINLSAGGYLNAPQLEDAVNYAYNNNVLIVAGMGNNKSKNKFYPAAYPNVLSVGATNALDTTASFSNYGEHLDVVAPGEMIYSLSHLNDTATTLGYNGTSMATPYVTGIASLLLAQDKTRTPAQLTELIQNNAEDLVGSNRDVPGYDIYYGYGRVNAYRILTNEDLEVQDTKQTQTANVFPNPAKEKLYITAKAPCTATLMNVQGQILYSAQVKNGLHAINLQNIAPGNYFVSLQYENSSEVVKVVVE